MWELSKDLGLLVRLALRLEPRVTAFHARYELSRWLRGLAAPRRSRAAPTALYIETSSFCRGRCRGCYVPARDRKAGLRLDDAVLGDAIAAARRLRLDWVCIVGGEPLDTSILDVNLALIRSAPDVRFLLCTGTHGRCDAALMSELALLPNLTVMFSIDGRGETHDRIRGAGSHARTIAALRAYSRPRGPVSGASVTVRPDNWQEVTSPEFVESLAAIGCDLLAYDPWFSDDSEKTLTPEELAAAITRLRALIGPSSLVFVNPFGRLRRDGFQSGTGMIAAAIDYRGNVYGSRRGAPLGDVTTARLAAILDGEAFRQGCRRLDLGGCAADDPRAPLFEATLARLCVIHSGGCPARTMRPNDVIEWS